MEPTLHSNGLGKNYGDFAAFVEPQNYYFARPTVVASLAVHAEQPRIFFFRLSTSELV